MPPFQTLDEVEAQTKDLDPDSPRAKDLWSSVFLDRTEVEELLDLVQAQKQFAAFVYPMFVMAAHTGARRSEFCGRWLLNSRCQTRALILVSLSFNRSVWRNIDREACC